MVLAGLRQRVLVAVKQERSWQTSHGDSRRQLELARGSLAQVGGQLAGWAKVFMQVGS